MFTFLFLQMFNDQVTEQARSSIEARVRESDEQQRKLEEKLQEVEKEKQAQEEQHRRAVDSLEEQVYCMHVTFISFHCCHFLDTFLHVSYCDR